MQAVVIAAGRGIRLKPLTDKIPKCMAAIKDKPILEHILERLVKAGIDEINLIVGYRREVIEEHFGPEFQGVKVNYFVQKEPKGTAHALSLFEGYAKEMFIVTNADVITSTSNYKRLMETDEFEKGDAFLLARSVKNPWRFGVLKTEKNRILGIVEKPKPGEEPSNIVNAGVYRFKKDFFESVRETGKSERGEFELVDSIKNYIAKGKAVEYRICEGMCIDVAGTDDLERADSLLDEMFPK